MIGQTAPTDPVDQFLQPGKDVERRVADLERESSRVAPTPATYAAVVAYGGNPAGITVLTAVYTESAKWVDVEVQFQQTGGSGAGALTVTLPSAVAFAQNSIVGHFILYDTSATANYVHEAFVYGSTNIAYPAIRAATGQITGTTSNTAPFSLAVGDFGTLRARYRRT